MRKNMSIEFPILTVPSMERSDFLNKLQYMADFEFKEMVVLSPFVDVHIVTNLVNRCVFKDKRLLIVTRYRQSLPEQQRLMDEAKKVAVKIKNYALEKKVRWEINERLHAKCVICDWKEVLFGSQNLTEFGGLGHRGKGNFELGIYIENIPKEYEKELREFVNEIVKTKNSTFYP